MYTNLTEDLKRPVEDWVSGSAFLSREHKYHGPLVTRINELAPKDILVLGEEFNRGLIAELKNAGHTTTSMGVVDSINTKFFKADLILCLEVLNHLPLWLAVELVNNIYDSEFSYVAINSCSTALENIGTGPRQRVDNSAI
jgi:hypothetical protein